MLVGWLTASAQMWGIIQPVQVLLLAFLPLLIKQDSRAGRCFENIKEVYNECFAP